MYQFKLIYNKHDTVYVISLIFVDTIFRGFSNPATFTVLSWYKAIVNSVQMFLHFLLINICMQKV